MIDNSLVYFKYYWCCIKFLLSFSWVSNESPDAMDEYVQSLLDSDLTLCPAGMNTETYRWIEKNFTLTMVVYSRYRKKYIVLLAS